MKKIILLGIAFMAIILSTASAGSYHQSDQLQSHLIVQQAPVVFDVFVAPATMEALPVLEVSYIFRPVIGFGNFTPTIAFAYLDPGLRINDKAVINYKQNTLYSYNPIPIVDKINWLNGYNSHNYRYVLRC